MNNLFNPFDYPTCLQSPLWIQDSAWAGHVPFAMFIISAMQPQTFVELGSHRGVSYCAFCQAVKESQTNTKCYAVDSWQGDLHAGSYDSEVLRQLKSHHDPLYGRFSTLLQSNFDEALPHFADGSVDLLHIDGYHSYEAVSHDFMTWLPKMSDCGIILFHDVAERGRGFGVYKFWDELIEKYPSFTFLHSHGLGVLSVGTEIPQNIKFLFEAKKTQTSLIRALFCRLGLGIVAIIDGRRREKALVPYENFVLGSKPMRRFYFIREKGLRGYLRSHINRLKGSR